jgi:membrane-anchored protein YejM (alkaline phosphatase superfamily)
MKFIVVIKSSCQVIKLHLQIVIILALLFSSYHIERRDSYAKEMPFVKYIRSIIYYFSSSLPIY